MDDSILRILDLIFIFLVYGLPILLLVLGLIVGGVLERSHFASIRKREETLIALPVFPTRTTDSDRVVENSELVVSSVVISLDYFKRFLAFFRNIFGGRVRSYESLLDRAKREAILRLKEQVATSDAIINLRIQTSTISSVHSRNKGIGGIEVIAYGTAIRYR